MIKNRFHKYIKKVYDPERNFSIKDHSLNTESFVITNILNPLALTLSITDDN